MRWVKHRSVVSVLVAAVFGIAAFSASAGAYSYASGQYYVRDTNGNYAYRTVSFQWGAWQGHLTALQSVTTSSRIIGPYAYYGWNLGGYQSWQAPTTPPDTHMDF